MGFRRTVVGASGPTVHGSGFRLQWLRDLRPHVCWPALMASGDAGFGDSGSLQHRAAVGR